MNWDTKSVPKKGMKTVGSGFGLSLSKQTMLKMGGDVILSTINEQLTQFVVVLGY
jgi:signal transduction histidine kinase